MELVVAGEGDEPAAGHGQGEEDLRGSRLPHLDTQRKEMGRLPYTRRLSLLI